MAFFTKQFPPMKGDKKAPDPDERTGASYGTRDSENEACAFRALCLCLLT